jgi:hypothetical protein
VFYLHGLEFTLHATPARQYILLHTDVGPAAVRSRCADVHHQAPSLLGLRLSEGAAGLISIGQSRRHAAVAVNNVAL